MELSKRLIKSSSDTLLLEDMSFDMRPELHSFVKVTRVPRYSIDFGEQPSVPVIIVPDSLPIVFF